MNEDERWDMVKDSVDYQRIQEGHDQLKGWFLTMGSSMLLIAVMFAIVFGIMITGCSSDERPEDAISRDLEYSVGQEPIPYAEGLVPHYTALDGTVWYDNAGSKVTQNHYEMSCKHCRGINFFPAHKIKKSCTWCGRTINNQTRAG